MFVWQLYPSIVFILKDGTVGPVNVVVYMFNAKSANMRTEHSLRSCVDGRVRGVGRVRKVINKGAQF